ncbi:hypothetical protein [Aliivibrio fischeri]|uniref:hypothetical protein n=1 Tax=Aliivibrio fischeri TaxID=668 RepID=UPI0012DAD532|nr:hypothetical protein [Aliivibrio fischeri]MUJ39348.1 hypothetical protein [Aliivibrio fischeri]
MKKVSLLAASVALALVGCGGSDGGSDTNTGTPSAGGIVITGFDGYFKNAVVFDDVNNDGILDVNVDTVFGLTKADGKITLPKGTEFQGSLALKTLKPSDTDKALAAKLAALSPAADSYSDFMNTYTTDMDHEGQPMANAVVFRAPISAEDKTAVISPLTDLVAIEMAKGTAENPVSEEAAIAAVTAALGGTDEQPIDLFSDFVKDSKTNLESAKLHKTAQILTESKAKNPTAYEKNSAEIAAVAQEESEKIVTDETMGSDDLLNQKPVINPSAPTAPVVSNYKLLVNEDAKIAIQKEISALAITEGQSLNTTITIPAALFQDKYDNVQTNVQAVAEINGKGEITANLVGETLTLSANNLQPTQDIYTITLKAEDKATANSEVLNTLSTTFSFKVKLQNSAPVVDTNTQANIQTLVDSWKMQQGAAFSQTFSVDGLFNDREGDALTYTTNINSVVPGLISKFNKNTGEMTISGIPQPKNLGELAFTIIADDGHPATRLASTPASFTLPAIEAGEIAIDANVKAELQAKTTAWQLKVGNEFNQTLNISELFDSAVNGDVQYYANYAEHDNAPASNPINGVNVTVEQSGLVTLVGTPTQVTNGVVLYLAQGINFSGGEDNDIESEMVLLNLPNVQPADEVTPPPTGTHPLENKNWYVLERGSDDGDGIEDNNYSRVWCDTYRFEDGIALSNNRSPSNSNTCSEETAPQDDNGTYVIDENNNLVATFTFIEDGEELTETFTVSINDDTNAPMDEISIGSKSVLFSMEEQGQIEHETKTFFAEKTDAEKRINVKSSDGPELRDAPLYWPGQQDGEYVLRSTSLQMNTAENSSGNSHDYIKVWINGVSCDGLFEGFDGDSPIFEKFIVTSDSISLDDVNGWHGNQLGYSSCFTAEEDGTPNAIISFLFGMNDNYTLNANETYSIMGKVSNDWSSALSDINFNMTWTGSTNND